MSDVLTAINLRNPAPVAVQTQATPAQVKNNTGGYVFEVSSETQIRRFLVLGTDKPTYYQNAAELTTQNSAVVIDWATHRTRELVDIILEISEAGRAPKQNPGLFALAAAAGLGDDDGRKYALSVLPRVARTGSTLFTFVKYVEQFRGWGVGLRRAVGNWYEEKDADKLAYQIVKYRQREGWTHRDLLRKTHPTGASDTHKGLYTYVTKGLVPNVGLENGLPSAIQGFEKAQHSTNVNDWINVVENYNVSWEMLPDAARTDARVWEALLDKGMPMGALIRQLPTLTRLGVLKGSRLTKVVAQLRNIEALHKSRIHPIKILEAQKTYESGRSVKGSSVWTPVTKIVDALNDAFYLCFANVEPANKRTMNALDVSGSMGGGYWGYESNTILSPREVSAAMSLITVATEPDVETYGFSRNFIKLNISPCQRLDDVIRTISGLPFDYTDCSLPMSHALKHSLEIDTFVVWTDNEANSGTHPFQALKQYRKASGIDAKLIVCTVTPTDFSIADPSDGGMLDIAAFDSNVPNLIADFSAGRI